MIEAYEIGIKLALQDGVSEGVAAIRRDLGALDQVIAQTTLRLAQLQRVGVQALAVSQEQPERAASGLLPRKPAPVVVAPPQPEPEPAATAAGVQPAAVPVRAPPMPMPAGAPAMLAAPQVPVEAGPAVRPLPTRPEVVAPMIAARLPAAVEVAAPGGPSVTTPPTGTPSTVAVPPALPVAVVLAARQTAPSLQAVDPPPQRGERQRGRESRPEPQIGVTLPVPVGRAVAPPTQAPVKVGSPDGVEHSPRPYVEGRAVQPRRPVAVPEPAVARRPPAPVRPAAVFSPVPPAAPGASPSYAPPAAASRGKEGSMRGDVFLDGARVGRWMSEQMARDAGRPNAGPTGFDPRRSAVWPGAAVTW